jgi:mono/diheme cytochrome c family protein
MGRHFLLWVCLVFGGAASAQTLEIVGVQKRVSINLRELKKKLPKQTITFDDPVYRRKMTYDAFPLRDLLQLAGASPEDKADELVFTASDGYSPNMKFSRLKNLKGYLAFQEHGKSGQFTGINQGKSKISPGPFYVVWEGDAQSEIPWPYQLVKIEVVDWAKKYPLVIPPNAAAESTTMKGFALFKAECIRCHSINLQGGDLGPELNAPQNVTEYWKPEVLRAFIHDAPSFRYKSKMPSFSHLKPEQIEQLISYLAHMKAFKIPAP